MEEKETLEEALSQEIDFENFFTDDTDQEDKPNTVYTTDLLEHVTEIAPTLTVNEAKELTDYLKGSSRPDFMEKMMNQTNEKLVETIKVMAIYYLQRIPTLLDYQKTLQANLLDPSRVQNMSYDEISKSSANIQREINELLTFALNVTKSLSSVNTTPTKVEKLANALMNVSEDTRERIEEILRLNS